MRAMLPFALICLLASYPATSQDAPLRDVLASAFRYPFLTDAEILERASDMEARITTDGGTVSFRYPGIRGVLLGGQALPGHLGGPDLWTGDLPAGTHSVQIVDWGAPPPTAPLAPPPAGAVTTAIEFQTRAASLDPGSQLIVADGRYEDWTLRVNAAGTSAAPVVIRPATPGGVVFRHGSSIRISGSFVVLAGFRFDHCGPQTAVHLTEAKDCRVTQCQFTSCGNPVSTFAHIVRVDMACHRNRVDHCYFTGSKSMSLGQRIVAKGELGTGNRFDHNLFRDIYRYWINGQENIQVGQNQRGDSGAQRPLCTVDHNVFDHAWGDGEIFSNKSSGNRYLYNVAAHCRRSAFTLRGGTDVRVEGNVMVDNSDGLRVMGTGHTIVNNWIGDHPGVGIRFETGHTDGESNVASEGSLIAHNTIVNCSAGAISCFAASDTRPHLPARNRFCNNIFSGGSGILLDTQNLRQSEILRNLFHATGGAQPGDTGKEALLADPLLAGNGVFRSPTNRSPVINAAMPLPAVRQDRWGRSRPVRRVPDIGADEVDSPEPRNSLPPIPPAPILAPQLHVGTSLFAQSTEHPAAGWQIAEGSAQEQQEALVLTNGSASLNHDLPGDFCLQWEYQPSTFTAVASLGFAIGNGASGYTLEWGGTARDGKPDGVIRLRKGNEKPPVADAADVLHYYQDFRHQRWLNRTLNERTTPDPGLWSRFTLLKHKDQFILLLANARHRSDPGFPVLVWEDPHPPDTGPVLRLLQQGTGRWRRFRVSEYEYTGDRKPPMVSALHATPVGGGRVDLGWQMLPHQEELTYEIHRTSGTDAPLTQASILTTVAGRTSWRDFAVQPQTRYIYTVVARNPLGRRSEGLATTVDTGMGGPSYEQLPAAAARAPEPPLVLAATPHLGRRYVWAPHGSPRFLTESPARGAAVFRFRIATPGVYAFWGLVLSPTNGTDSFYAALDAHTGTTFRLWNTGIHGTWTWSRILPSADLGAGDHRLTIKPREPGTRLAAVLVTSDTELLP